MKDLIKAEEKILNQAQPPYLLKYQQQFAENPSSRVFAPLAEAYRKLGRYKEAVEVLQKGLKNHPQYILAHISIAHCAYDQKKYQLCLDYLSKFKDQYADNLKLQMLMASSSIELGKWAEAKMALKKLSENGVKEDWLKNYWQKIPSHKVSSDPAKEETSSKEEISSSEDWRTVNLVSKNTQIKTSEDEPKDIPLPPQIDEKESSIEEDSTDDQQRASSSPMITFTLAELYLAQGHYKKALEVLYKFAEIGHDGPALREKVEEIKALQKQSNEPDTSALVVDTEEDTGEVFLNLGDDTPSLEAEEESDSPLLVLDDVDEDLPDTPPDIAQTIDEPALKIDVEDDSSQISPSLVITEDDSEGHEELLAAVEKTQDQKTAHMQKNWKSIEKAYDSFLEKLREKASKKNGEAG